MDRHVAGSLMSLECTRLVSDATVDLKGRKECIKGVPSRFGASFGILLAYIRLLGVGFGDGWR